MIWNTASTVIYNGRPVNSVYCNGIKIWPSAQPTPIYSWSASGYNSIATGHSNYGLIQPLNVTKFTWLTTATTSVDTILNNTAYYYRISNNHGSSGSPVRRSTASSFNQATKLYNFWLTMRVSGQAESSNYNTGHSAQLSIPRILYDYSGDLGHTSTINGVATSSYIRYGFTTNITGSATITALWARIALQNTVATPSVVSSDGPSVYNRQGTAYMPVGMTSYWTASGVYRP